MTNGDKFMEVFGLYATELWAKSEDEFLEWLNTLAEPERKTGKWIYTGWKIYRCSNCGNTLDFHGVNAGRGDANFCPNCGAEMMRDE